VAQEVECLPSKCEAVTANSSTARERKREEGREEGKEGRGGKEKKEEKGDKKEGKRKERKEVVLLFRVTQHFEFL
jgi:hypothetical protein